MGIGLLSAGIGEVPPAQTFIDIGQGARINPSLYEEPLPPVRLDPGFDLLPPRVPADVWRQVRDRAAGAPADLRPGILGMGLTRANAALRADPPTGRSGVILVDEAGAIRRGSCGRRPCPRVVVKALDLGSLSALVDRLRGGDLAIALERPPPDSNHGLAIGAAGPGLRGTLTSDSTRMRGFVLSTDIAPTILDRLDRPVPDEVSGEPIHSDGAVDHSHVAGLANRLAVIGPRRGTVIGATLAIWAGLAVLAAVAFGAGGLRTALPPLAVALAYLPAVLLLTAGLEPSTLAEWLIAGLGAPALALATLRLVPAWGALAIAGAVTVVAYAADVIAGSGLTELSLMGPNPVGGVRFFGIGNELEATVSALVPIATGAALAAWAPRVPPPRAAIAFALAGLAAVAAFAPGSFGADVGAAIAIPIGIAVAVAACLGGPRRRLLLLVALPIAALAALAGVDLALGGDAHLSRSVLQAGGLDELSDVAERRLRLSAANFDRYAGTPMLWAATLAIVAGIWQRRRIEAWFGSRRAAWAGFLGAGAATLAGALANDSGALFLLIGTALVAVTAGLAWATAAKSPDFPDSRERVR